MANQGTIDNTIQPTFWLNAFDEMDAGMYNLHKNVSRKVESILGTKGKSVSVPLTPDLGRAKNYTPGSTIKKSAIDQKSVEVTLDRSINKTITLNDEELSMTELELIKGYGVPMAESLLRTVGEDIYLEMMKSKYFIDATGGLAATNILAAKAALSKRKVGGTGRRIFAGVDDYNTMAGFTNWENFAYSGEKANLQEGIAARKYGFDIYEESAIDNHAPSDMVGAINGIGHNTGATTITVDGFTDAVGTDSDGDVNVGLAKGSILPGDTFKITGETGTPLHTVISTVRTSDATTSISFYPALAGNVADDAAVTFVARRSILAYHPAGIAFAARPYKPVVESSGVRSDVFVINGIPVRISTWYENLVLNLQMDLVYGVKTINENRIQRIITA